MKEGERVVLHNDDDKSHLIREIRPFGGMGDTVFTRCGKMRLIALTLPDDGSHENCEACDEVS